MIFKKLKKLEISNNLLFLSFFIFTFFLFLTIICLNIVTIFNKMNSIIKNAKIIITLIPRKVCIYEIDNIQTNFRWTWLQPVQKVKGMRNTYNYFSINLISR